MAKKDVHVVPRGKDWAVVKEGAERASKLLPTKEKAEAAGREAAKQEKSELVIHGKNGQIQEKNSFGNDPNPPKDKK